MTTADRVRAFIIDELQFDGDPDELTDDLALIDAQIVDSMGIFKLTSFCEDEFGIEIADEELVPETFSSIASIAALIEGKLQP
jgi:acyl carrier protein